MEVVFFLSHGFMPQTCVGTWECYTISFIQMNTYHKFLKCSETYSGCMQFLIDHKIEKKQKTLQMGVRCQHQTKLSSLNENSSKNRFFFFFEESEEQASDDTHLCDFKCIYVPGSMNTSTLFSTPLLL